MALDASAWANGLSGTIRGVGTHLAIRQDDMDFIDIQVLSSHMMWATSGNAKVISIWENLYICPRT